MRMQYLSSLLLLSLVFAEVPPEVKQDYTPPKAQIGYGNTLFESANRYCMHCHYDLHETWRNSMHAKAWSDPIFQKLYQAFLKRLVSEKLGKTGPTGTLDVAKAQEVGKICLGCHAPMALYSKDFKLTIEEVESIGQEENTFKNFNPDLETVLYAINKNTGKTYKITYHIGNPNNREGISCALCHSIEEIKMAHPGSTYTLSNPLKAGPIGPILYPAGYTLHFDDEKERNAYFSIVGPEFYSDYGDTRNSQKVKDGRFRIKPIPLDGQNGKTHYAGGPYYGPYGLTALDNVADDDETDRRAIANTSGFRVPENHYNKYAKTLCLSCHQRSAKTIDKNPENTLGLFMELCTTLNAIDPTPEPTAFTPKCTTCHMEERKGILINKWKRENEPWDINKIPTEGIKELMRRSIFASHRFEGASSPDKVRSGVEVRITSVNVVNDKVEVKYYIKNKTAHMFPGAHPMRRVITILKVYDENGNELPLIEAYGFTKFEDVEYFYNKPGFAEPIRVQIKKRENPVTFLGKVEDVNGKVCSQWIDSTSKLITDECDKPLTRFVRIYGRELINLQTASIAPGFSANTSRDNRLAPTEVEYYKVYFELPENYYGSVKAVLKAYYHKVGASGIVPLSADGFINLDEAKSKKLPIYLLHSVEVVYEPSGDDGGCNTTNFKFIGLLAVIILLRRFLTRLI